METLLHITALLTALNDDEIDGWMPRSMLYVALNCDMQKSKKAIAAASRAGYVVTTAEIVKITAEGRKVARELEVELAKKEAREAAQGRA